MNSLVSTLFLLAVKLNSIFEGVRQMKEIDEIIIVAGENKFEVGWLRRCLREQGYSSIPCKTVKGIIEELNILPTCGAPVSLVVIEPEILRDISDDLVAQLSECALDVPFLLFYEIDVQADLMEVFEQICAYRIQFRPEENQLANVLKEAGVEITCD